MGTQRGVKTVLGNGAGASSNSDSTWTDGQGAFRGAAMAVAARNVAQQRRDLLAGHHR